MSKAQAKFSYLSVLQSFDGGQWLDVGSCPWTSEAHATVLKVAAGQNEDDGAENWRAVKRKGEKRTRKIKWAPSFETVYRKIRAEHTDKPLFVEFARYVYEMKGRKFTRIEHGKINWVWAQNELKASHEGKATAKALCWDCFCGWENDE